MGLSGGASLRNQQAAQYFLLGTPLHPLSSVTLSLPTKRSQAEVKVIHVSDSSRW